VAGAIVLRILLKDCHALSRSLLIPSTMAACSRPPALSKTYSGNYDRVVTSEHFSTLPRDLRAALEELEPKCTAKDEVDIEHFLDMTKVVNQMRANRSMFRLPPPKLL